ncbi:TonB-dependent receptor [Epilithonimonas mollis]|uniref:TonB-dependent Receptor Plug Domain n=1 Tax=Epilithonimonas mollis TaxID=216903 RepID=A0A1M6PXM4_9FLAO|nr:TonB-dependent receptor [Epilithonimonas mollis]SHK12652.1 TonB-dependent Receptor Plug Domain [Epilithonimonas mollis]
MKMLSRKPLFILAMTMTTASFYFAQSTQDTLSKDNDIEQVVLTGVADIAKDRKTPVAVSTIKEAQIVERLGNQEFPEILNTTPSVYATKGGGGFGDGRVNVRGFDMNNTAVMINGVPVNDMESGAVYWSNWAGLSDVTSAIQIQRGLGSSKLAIASIGGTINVLTRAADKKREGNVTVGVGNDGYLKTLFSYNTGKSNTGWSSSFLMSRTAGNTYVDGSQFESYNYYFALGYQKGKHDFQFTFTGAPQWHNQNFQSSIANFIKYGNGVDEPNRRYNSNWGYLNGSVMSQSVNFYSKPVASINWDWNISEKSKLSSVLYASWGRGGGTGVLGSINNTGINNLPKTTDGLIRFDDIAAWNQGQNVIWNPNVANNTGINKVNGTPGIATRTNGLVRRSHINSHDWYGFLTNFQHKINSNWNFSVGLDGRYYYAYHPGVISEFWGNSEYRENQNLNMPPYYTVTQAYEPKPSANPFVKAIKDKSQIASRNFDGEVMWLGSFGQLEYSNEQISAFVQGSVSNQQFQRIDNWIINQDILNPDGTIKTPQTVQQGQKVNTKTGFKGLWGYNAKGGINYNINEQHNVFANLGYYSKQPNNYAVYPNNQQVLNDNLQNEKIASAELGYGFRSPILRANVNLYYTTWKDRFQRITNINIPTPTPTDANATTRAYANLLGIQEVHMGVEFEGTLKVTDYLDFNAMLSVGDWKYKNNPTGELFDDNNIPLTNVPSATSNSVQLALDGVKVSDAAQTTAALGFTLKPVKDLSIFSTWRYADKLYGVFNIDQNFIIKDGVVPAAAKKGALEYPSYNLFDLGASYTFKLNNDHRLTITGNVYNLLDTVYISDGKSSTHIRNLSDFTATQTQTAQQQYDAYLSTLKTWKGIDQNNTVFFGFGRTWSASLSYRF